MKDVLLQEYPIQMYFNSDNDYVVIRKKDEHDFKIKIEATTLLNFVSEVIATGRAKVDIEPKLLF